MVDDSRVDNMVDESIKYIMVTYSKGDKMVHDCRKDNMVEDIIEDMVDYRINTESTARWMITKRTTW